MEDRLHSKPILGTRSPAAQKAHARAARKRQSRYARGSRWPKSICLPLERILLGDMGLADKAIAINPDSLAARYSATLGSSSDHWAASIDDAVLDADEMPIDLIHRRNAANCYIASSALMRDGRTPRLQELDEGASDFGPARKHSTSVRVRASTCVTVIPNETSWQRASESERHATVWMDAKTYLQARHRSVYQRTSHAPSRMLRVTEYVYESLHHLVQVLSIESRSKELLDAPTGALRRAMTSLAVTGSNVPAGAR